MNMTSPSLTQNIFFKGRRSSLTQLIENLKDWSIRDKTVFGRDKKEKINPGNFISTYNVNNSGKSGNLHHIHYCKCLGSREKIPQSEYQHQLELNWRMEIIWTQLQVREIHH